MDSGKGGEVETDSPAFSMWEITKKCRESEREAAERPLKALWVLRVAKRIRCAALEDRKKSISEVRILGPKGTLTRLV